jgi:ABC-type glutathione transport system ATPase component
MGRTVIVSVKGVRKQFVQGGLFPWSPKTLNHALQGVDLQVHAGEVVALVGQSGSGKTTLARIVLGLEEPTSGSIELEGLRWDGLAERERHPHRIKYQYVPQDPMAALDPQQTALEHVTETLRVLGKRSQQDALLEAREMLERLGLKERLHALPREMSGGEQRRVTLARVLSLTPRLVVADEPTSGLEPDRRAAVLQALIGNLPTDAGCILVTHDMSAARRWAHRVLVMLAGRVIEELDLRESDPLHPYAQVLFDPWGHPAPEAPLAKQGCPFVDNCSLPDSGLLETCRRTVPSLGLAPSGHSDHRVACHHHVKGEA